MKTHYSTWFLEVRTVLLRYSDFLACGVCLCRLWWIPIDTHCEAGHKDPDWNSAFAVSVRFKII